jgi:hypothetical protein
MVGASMRLGLGAVTHMDIQFLDIFWLVAAELCRSFCSVCKHTGVSFQIYPVALVYLIVQFCVLLFCVQTFWDIFSNIPGLGLAHVFPYMFSKFTTTGSAS